MKRPRIEPLPRTQEELRKFCIRHERRLWLGRLLVYVPLMAPASVLSPAWVGCFFGVAWSFWDAVQIGVWLWLAMGLAYVFVDGVSLYHILFCPLILGVSSYLIGLLVCLYRYLRPFFPWEPKIGNALGNGKAPETVLTRPRAARVVWKPGEDGTYMSAYFGINLESDGYSAFEIVVENPSAPIHASLDSPFPSHYQDKEETMGQRSVYRFYGRFSAGVHTFHLYTPGPSEPDTTVTQLVG